MQALHGNLDLEGSFVNNDERIDLSVDLFQFEVGIKN
jgi:hypothetical protein